MTKTDWLEKEGFNSNGCTYVYYGADSYSIKDQLKAAGFRFNRDLLWHTADADNAFKDKCFEVHYTTVLQLMNYGRGFYFETTEKKIKDKIASYNPKPESNSKFIEPVNGKIDVEAECIDHKVINSMYGLSNLFVFKAGEDIISWFTSSNPSIEVGDKGELVGCFKKHETYNGINTTYITRARLK